MSADITLNWGPHNAQQAICTMMDHAAACGEAAMGLIRHSEAMQRASGLAVAGPGATGSVEDAQAYQRRIANDVLRHNLQVKQGMAKAVESWQRLIAVLSAHPASASAPSKAAEVVQAAGTTEAGPKLALA